MKKNILLLFFILAGAMVGSLIASAAAGVPMLSWLAYSETIGIPTANPAYLDLAVVRVAFGLEMGLSIAQIGAYPVAVRLSLGTEKDLRRELIWRSYWHRVRPAGRNCWGSAARISGWRCPARMNMSLKLSRRTAGGPPGGEEGVRSGVPVPGGGGHRFGYGGGAGRGDPRQAPQPEEAVSMLRRLSGREHRVHTAVQILSPAGSRSLVSTAEVHFAP